MLSIFGDSLCEIELSLGSHAHVVDLIFSKFPEALSFYDFL